MTHVLIHMMIDNPDMLAAYREKAGAALAKHGGKLEAASPTPTKLEGSLPVPHLAGVLSFPDNHAAMAWINDPELAETHALRRGAGDSSLILVG